MLRVIIPLTIFSITLQSIAVDLAYPHSQHLSKATRALKPPCPYKDGTPTTVDIKDGLDQPHTLTIKFSTFGTQNCVYDVLDGVGEPSILKTPLEGSEEAQRTFPIELEALHDLSQLIFEGSDPTGRLWGVIKRAHGTLLWDHPEYKTLFPEGYNYLDASLTREEQQKAIDECDKYMKSRYTLILNSLGTALKDFGWKSDDINWENFYFSIPNDSAEPVVTIVDWGRATKVRGDRARAWAAMRARYRKALEASDSAMPLRDGDLFQGICQSQRRGDGEAWQPPAPLLKAMKGSG